MSTSEGQPTQIITALISDAAASVRRLVVIDTTDTTDTLLVAKLAADGSAFILGVLTNATTAADQQAGIAIAGVAEVEVDGTVNGGISEGDAITSDSVGRGVKAGTSAERIGVALAPSSAAGDVIPVLIDRRVTPAV